MRRGKPCELCEEPAELDPFGVCATCNALITCPTCRGATLYTLDHDGGTVCSHCEPERFRALDAAGRLF